MNNIYVWVIIIIVSIAFGISEHISVADEKGIFRRIFDVWRHAANYFITASLIYYFIVIRWPIIKENEIATSDFILGMIIMVGIFGWWPYVIKNFTEGIDTIISKFKN